MEGKKRKKKKRKKRKNKKRKKRGKKEGQAGKAKRRRRVEVDCSSGYSRGPSRCGLTYTASTVMKGSTDLQMCFAWLLLRSTTVVATSGTHTNSKQNKVPQTQGFLLMTPPSSLCTVLKQHHTFVPKLIRSDCIWAIA